MHEFRCKSRRKNPILWDDLGCKDEAEFAEISFLSTYFVSRDYKNLSGINIF